MSLRLDGDREDIGSQEVPGPPGCCFFVLMAPERVCGLCLLKTILTPVLDYLHITKRFGHIAASQFPLHFMLTMRTQYSPLALAFGTSHEELNPWHRVSGRVIYFLLLNHALWYLNYFVQAGVAYKRLTSAVVIIGIISFLAITILTTTALAAVRRWSYRVFFMSHLILGIAVLPLLFVHTKELRFYVAEAFALFICDIALKRLDTSTGLTTISKVANTKLIKLKIPIPPAKFSRFAAAPGQHVYLSIPGESIPKNAPRPSLHEFLFNPFTIAEVSPTDVTLVLRTQNGPTTSSINTLAALSKAKPPINIQGPYGAARGFPNFLDKYDRVLLVAGGVGATFILPIYRELRTEMESESISSDRLKFIWSMRSAAEAAWAITSPAEPSLENDEHVKVYLTRSNASERPNSLSPDSGVELDNLRQVGKSIKPTGGRERPDLKKIVDDVFSISNEERIAVLVCGPQGLASELRKHVGSWVMNGREVWWHDESLYATFPFLLHSQPLPHCLIHPT